MTAVQRNYQQNLLSTAQGAATGKKTPKNNKPKPRQTHKNQTRSQPTSSGLTGSPQSSQGDFNTALRSPRAQNSKGGPEHSDGQGTRSLENTSTSIGFRVFKLFSSNHCNQHKIQVFYKIRILNVGQKCLPTSVSTQLLTLGRI